MNEEMRRDKKRTRVPLLVKSSVLPRGGVSVLSLDKVELVGRVVRLVVRPEFDGGAQNQSIRLRRERVQNHISVTHAANSHRSSKRSHHGKQAP